MVFPLFVVFLGDGAHIAQKLCRRRGFIFPAVGHLNGHTGHLIALFGNMGNGGDIQRLHHGNGGIVTGKLIVLQIVPQTDDGPARFQRQVGVHLVAVTEQAEQPGGGQFLHRRPFLRL